GHERRKQAGERDQRRPEAARAVEAGHRRGDGEIEEAGVAEDLDGDEQREENEQQVDVDGRGGRAHGHAAAENEKRRHEGGANRDGVIAEEPHGVVASTPVSSWAETKIWSDDTLSTTEA